MTEVDRADFFAVITSFERSAWRWECQGTYHEPDEREPLRAWRAGRPDHTFLDGWLALVRRMREEGKTFERVRMVTDPPTEYLRWMLSFTHLNVEAGEDIRWLSESDATMFGAPLSDFYLLDDRRVVTMRFGDNGVSGATVSEDRETVERARRWRTIAWANATPHTEYMSRNT